MRVLQLIDALSAGGAERVAVNIANAFANRGIPSFLVTTRGEGLLKLAVLPNVKYQFLARKKIIDLKAIKTLIAFINSNRITHIHAHSTSYFMASLIKIMKPKLKLIWHAHEGKKANSTILDNKMLFLCSFLFSGIITVNNDLLVWAKKTLNTKKVFFLQNFVPISLFKKQTQVKKQHVVICLANLRQPKNHMGLLIAWSQLNQENWELHLIGADYEDNYSRLIKEFITINNLQKTVKLLGTRQGVSLLLNQASIGVLASNSEGLPLALIEYGAASLAVISTDVGQCKAVIGEHGIVVNTNSSTELSEALSRFMLDKELRILKAKRFSEQIKASFTEIGAIPKLIDYYSSL